MKNPTADPKSPSCYSDPGIVSICVWCLNGSYDEIDYIEEIMCERGQNKASRLGIKIRGRYYEPECGRCKRRRKQYKLEDVLEYICKNENNVDQHVVNKQLNEIHREYPTSPNKVESPASNVLENINSEHQNHVTNMRQAAIGAVKMKPNTKNTTMLEIPGSNSSSDKNSALNSPRKINDKLIDDKISQLQSIITTDQQIENRPNEKTEDNGVFEPLNYYRIEDLFNKNQNSPNNEDKSRKMEGNEANSDSNILQTERNLLTDRNLSSLNDSSFSANEKLEIVGANEINKSPVCDITGNFPFSINMSPVSTNSSMDRLGNPREMLVLVDEVTDSASSKTESLNSVHESEKGEILTNESVNSLFSKTESLITLKESENDELFDTQIIEREMEKLKNNSQVIPFGETIVQFSLSILGDDRPSATQAIILPFDGINSVIRDNNESIISTNKMNDQIKRHEPASRINKYYCGESDHPVLTETMEKGNYNDELITISDVKPISRDPSPTSAKNEKNFDVEVKDMLRLAEKRASEKPLYLNTRFSPNHVKRFIVTSKIQVYKMKDIVAINDLKTSVIRDQIHKKGRNSNFQYNWMQLRDSIFTIYNGKIEELSDKFKEDNGDLICPDNENMFLTRKYTIDVKNFQIHIMLNTEFRNSFLARLNCRRRNCQTIDISDKNIKSILPFGKEYKVIIKNEQSECIYIIPFLEFALVKGDEIYSYRVDSINAFLKWILAIELRQGKVKWPIS